MLLEDILRKAEAEGLTLIAYHDNENDPDYSGTHAQECLKALEACDLMHCRIENAAGTPLAAMLIINDIDADPEERIADYLMTPWMQQFEKPD